MSQDRHFQSRYLAFLKLTNKVDPECQRVPDLSFPEDYPDPEKRQLATKAAKKICRSCEMVEECFTYALETNQRHGIWGATSPDER